MVTSLVWQLWLGLVESGELVRRKGGEKPGLHSRDTTGCQDWSTEGPGASFTK
jgi:hypothetical protein